jgi:hypothetical protein
MVSTTTIASALRVAAISSDASADGSQLNRARQAVSWWDERGKARNIVRDFKTWVPLMTKPDWQK